MASSPSPDHIGTVMVFPIRGIATISERLLMTERVIFSSTQIYYFPPLKHVFGSCAFSLHIVFNFHAKTLSHQGEEFSVARLYEMMQVILLVKHKFSVSLLTFMLEPTLQKTCYQTDCCITMAV